MFFFSDIKHSICEEEKIKASRSPTPLADLHKLEDNRLVGSSPPVCLAVIRLKKSLFLLAGFYTTAIIIS